MGFKTITGEAATDSRGSVFENGIQNSAVSTLSQGPAGPQGPQGPTGDNGQSVATVTQSTVDADGNITFTFFLTDGTEVGMVTVPAGEAITDIVQTPAMPERGENSVITISFDQRADQEFTIPSGVQGAQGQFVEQLFARDPDGTTLPDVPTAAMFVLDTGTISGLNGWSDTVPVGDDQLYEIRANVDPVLAVNGVVPIAEAAWGVPFQAGSEGPAGDPGPAGQHGDSISTLTAVFNSTNANGDNVYDLNYSQTTYDVNNNPDTTVEDAGMFTAPKGDTGDQGDQGVGVNNVMIAESATQTDPTTGTDYDLTFDLVNPDTTGTTPVDPVVTFIAPRGEEGMQGPQGIGFQDVMIGLASSDPATGNTYNLTFDLLDPEGTDPTDPVVQFTAPPGPAGPPGTAQATLFDSSVTYDLGDFVFDSDDNLYMSLTASNNAALSNATAWLHVTAEVDTTYTFTDGTNGTFTVTPEGGAAQTVSVGTFGVGAQDEGSAVTGNFTTLNFIGSGVTASDGGSGVLNINITGGGGTTFSPSVAVGAGWPGASNAVGTGTDPVVSFTVSNFAGFTLTGLTVSGDVVNSNVDADFEGGSFTFDYDASVPGTYTVHFDVTATDNTHGETFTHRVTHSSRVYAPVYAQVLAAQPTAVSDFTGSGTEFGSEFSFEFAGTGMAYMLVPMEVSSPVFRSGFLFLNNTNLGVIDTNWTLYRIDDYVAPGTLTVTLTDGG